MKRKQKEAFIHQAAIGIILVGLFDTSFSAQQAVLFDNNHFQGDTLTLSLDDDCHNLKKDWRDRVSSLKIQEGSCMIVWDYENCRGRSLQLTPETLGSEKLSSFHFDSNIRSISNCPTLTDGDFRTISGSDEDDSEPPPEEINFFDEPNFGGNVFTLTTSGNCYTFKSKWMNRVSSMESQACVNIWDKENCQGRPKTVTPSSVEKRNLNRIRFDKRIKSVRLCSLNDVGMREGKKESDSNVQRDFRNRYRHNNDPTPPKDENFDVLEVALKEQNKYRRLHGVVELRGDPKLQKMAQSYAEYLAQNDQFRHSTNFDYGENLAGTSTRNKKTALKEAIQLWYDEINNYDFNRPPYSLKAIKVGHFTALIWKETTHVGIGMAWNPKKNWWIVVANYDPPGNLKGAYGENVPPPLNN